VTQAEAVDKARVLRARPIDHAFEPKTKSEQAACLADAKWRICSGWLYKIMVKSPNEAGETTIPFKPNRAQRRFMDRLWPARPPTRNRTRCCRPSLLPPTEAQYVSYKRGFLPGRVPHAGLCSYTGCSSSMLVDVVRLRIEGQKRSRETVLADTPIRGVFSLSPARPGYYEGQRNAPLLAGLVAPGGTSWLLPPLDGAVVRRVRGNDLIVAGVEEIAHGRNYVNYQQVWWCRVVSHGATIQREAPSGGRSAKISEGAC
jgi:hypothetical protein